MRRPLLPTSCAVVVLLTSLVACSGDEPAAEPTSSDAPVAQAGTEPGTALSYGDSATLVWQPTSSITGELEVSVDAVAEQRQSVLDGWLRDDAMAASRPYFVTVTVTNTGASDLGGQAVPVYLRDDNGKLGAAWTFGGDFTACPSGPLPTPFATGAETETCLVYLAPDGARVDAVVFEPDEGYDPITWTGDVERPKPVRRKKSG